MKQTIINGLRATTVLAMGALLAGCTGNSGTIGSTPFTTAAAQNDALNQRVDDLFLAEGNTQLAEVPTTNQVTYNGLIHGEPNGGGGSAIEYYADLELNVDFDSSEIGGTVDNFRTDLAGFTAPTGSATVFVPNSFVAGALLEFEASGTLTGTDRDADVDIFNANGTFVGDSAQAARGTHETDFIWTSGPDDTLISFSDGDWAVED